MNENDIIIEIQRGNSDLFSRLVDIYKTKVFTCAYKFTNDYSEAQDLSQEIFIKIYNNIPKFRFESSLSTWIYKITTNMCIDHKRKKKVKFSSFNEDYSHEASLGIKSNSKDGSPEEIVISNEKQREVHRIIYNLPDIYKTVIIMYHFNELSYKEISASLNVSEKTVETRLYRARRLLRDELLKRSTGGGTGWNVKKL